MKVNLILQMGYIFIIGNELDQFELSNCMNSLA